MSNSAAYGHDAIDSPCVFFVIFVYFVVIDSAFILLYAAVLDNFFEISPFDSDFGPTVHYYYERFKLIDFENLSNTALYAEMLYHKAHKAPTKKMPATGSRNPQKLARSRKS